MESLKFTKPTNGCVSQFPFSQLYEKWGQAKDNNYIKSLQSWDILFFWGHIHLSCLHCEIVSTDKCIFGPTALRITFEIYFHCGGQASTFHSAGPNERIRTFGHALISEMFSQNGRWRALFGHLQDLWHSIKLQLPKQRQPKHFWGGVGWIGDGGGAPFYLQNCWLWVALAAA